MAKTQAFCMYLQYNCVRFFQRVGWSEGFSFCSSLLHSQSTFGICLLYYRIASAQRSTEKFRDLLKSTKTDTMSGDGSESTAAAAAAAKKLNLEKATNFMKQYRDPESRELKKLSANQFTEVWSHYDKDGNGYIEGTELDGFLREFVASANKNDISPEAVSDAMLAELKQCFMEAYDDNQDGKIDIRELAQLLPMEENFLLLFRFDNPLDSSVEFMRIWREYDTDGSGYIEADELKNFLRDLLREAKKIHDVSEDKLIEYTDTMLQVFDANRDGKLQLSEMAKLLPVKENFLCRQAFKGATKLTKEDIERVFSLYDRDNNGTIENEELRGFLKDLLELVKKDYDAQDLLDFEETIMRGVDYNKDGKINKKELTMILLAIARHNQDDD
ncbi:calbindin-32 isoform X2 [Planococcus citri]|uniref:calbindin-32 isoform X2 n=1 Tax=Planococcus citri TaxID=170843 RepID=UPI0031F9B65D